MTLDLGLTVTAVNSIVLAGWLTTDNFQYLFQLSNIELIGSLRVVRSSNALDISGDELNQSVNSPWDAVEGRLPKVKWSESHT